MNIICHPSSVVRHLSSVVRSPSSVVRSPSSVIPRNEGQVRSPSSVIRRLSSDFYRGKRVLVTGHTGFKGTWLSLWLHVLGARVTGYALQPPT